MIVSSKTRNIKVNRNSKKSTLRKEDYEKVDSSEKLDKEKKTKKCSPTVKKEDESQQLNTSKGILPLSVQKAKDFSVNEKSKSSEADI